MEVPDPCGVSASTALHLVFETGSLLTWGSLICLWLACVLRGSSHLCFLSPGDEPGKCVLPAALSPTPHSLRFPHKVLCTFLDRLSYLCFLLFYVLSKV